MRWVDAERSITSEATNSLEVLVSKPALWNSDERVLFRSASMLYKLGRNEDCLTFIRLIRQKRSDLSEKASVGLIYLRGDVLHELKRFKDAVGCYAEILIIEESDIAYGNKALAHWELGEFDRALADYQNAIRLNPGNTSALRGGGEMQLKLGFPLKAISYLAVAVKLRPRYSEALSALGVSYLATGQAQLARKALLGTLKIDPEDARARAGIGRMKAAQSETKGRR